MAHAQLAGEILSNVLDPLLTLDRDLRVNTANPAFGEAFALQPEQVLGRSVYEIAEGIFDLPDLRDLLRDVQQHDRSFRDFEITHDFESTRRRTMLVNAGPLPTGGGEPPLIVLAMKDITSQKQVEHELRRSEQQLRMIFENAREFAIITMDLDGRITTWNAGAQHLLGYAESEVLGRDARIIFTQADRKMGEADWELRQAIDEGRAENERWHVRKDGSLFWGSGLVMPLRDGRDICGLMKIMRDMTAEHRLREEREARAKELEQRVAEATVEAKRRAADLETLTRHLYQAEVRERQRLSEVLHDDLQQVLAALQMRLKMAERGAGDQEHLQEATSLAEHAVETARTLSHELNPQILREQGFIPALQWLGENMQERHHLSVQVEADGAAADAVPSDVAEVLFQMVRELLFNVVKHARASQAWVRLEASPENALHLTVDDDGVGCVRDLATPEGDNIGSGLASIRERLKVWHGVLEAGERPGGGCRLVLKLPLSGM